MSGSAASDIERVFRAEYGRAVDIDRLRRESSREDRQAPAQARRVGFPELTLDGRLLCQAPGTVKCHQRPATQPFALHAVTRQ